MKVGAAVLATSLLVFGACSGSESPRATPAGPSTSATSRATDVVDASISLEPDHALVGRLVIDTDEASVPTIQVDGPERSFTIPVSVPATHHEIAVAGLRERQSYTVTVTDGGTTTTLTLTTGSVPDEFPDLDVRTADLDEMSHGFTLFNLLDLTDELGAATDDPIEPAVAPERHGYLVAVDDEGEIVWYHRADRAIGDVRQLPDGTLLHEYNDTAARRIDLFGQTLDEWGGQIITGPLAIDSNGRQVVGDDAVPVATDSMHHEVSVLPNGNLLALSSELRTVTGFTEDLCVQGAAFDGSLDLISDIVVEFTPTGEIVHSYPLSDYLDPVTRSRDQEVCGLPFDQIFPNFLYRAQGFAEARDWTHANAVVLDPTGDFFTVSVRHIDAVLQIERATGALAWRFGPGGNFTVDAPADFAYHQHAPEWQEDGTLLLYDNGNGRPGPEGTAPVSRVVQFELDPDAGTSSIVWEYPIEIDGIPAFASFVGDADRLDNGNVLVATGGLAGRDDRVTVQLVEVEPESGKVVFELRIADPDRDFAVYRSERLPSFYPEPMQ